MDIYEIALKIKNHGGRLYLVGGSVRDEIIGKSSNDKDFCVVGLDEKEFVNLFKEAKLIGKTFPVFILYGNEFALARTEKKISNGYKGFKTYSSKNITIYQDLKRRDITINAIAKDVLTGEYIDPFLGIEDIKLKRIRHISDAFLEDPLRAYRVARLAATLLFRVDSSTINKMQLIKKELPFLSSQRVFEELKKSLKGNNPSIFFKVLKDANLLDVHFKELNDLENFNNVMSTLDEVSKSTNSLEVRFSSIFCNSIDNIALIDTLSKRIQIPNKWIKKAKDVYKYSSIVCNYKKLSPYKQAKLFNKINNSSVTLEELELIINSYNLIIKKEKIKFAKMLRDIFKNINGKKLISEGIIPEKVGNINFSNILLKRQAKALENYKL